MTDGNPDRNYTYLKTVRGMCRTCRGVHPARVFIQDAQVWQQTLCPTCGVSTPARIAGDATWYLTHGLRLVPEHAPLRNAHAPRKGCPHDCGPCTWHASPCQLPVVSITNACELRCPICFTHNRSAPPYFMPATDMRRTVDWIVTSSGPVDLINLTGGEPTLHPDLPAILDACRHPEIGRITLNTNGIRLATDQNLCDQLAERRVCVVLSLHSLDPKISQTIHGADLVETKLRCIENLRRAGARMTLLHVMAQGVNDTETPQLISLLRQHRHILSLTAQTMTYTGQGGASFPRSTHIPVDEAARRLVAASNGELAFTDFVTRPSAHPLCYLASYLLRDGSALLPLTRFLSPERASQLLAESYLLRPGDASSTFFREIADSLFAAGDLRVLPHLRALMNRLYPATTPLSTFEKQRLAEDSICTLYVHSHMDEDTFDTARVMTCPDLVPAHPGRLIPACTYNLFYRRQDPRFFEPPTPHTETPP